MTRSRRQTAGQSMVEQVVLLLAAAGVMVFMFGFVRSTFMGHYKGGADSVSQGLRYTGWR